MNPSSDHALSRELDQHAAYVRRLARSPVRGDAQADDGAQETWLAALRHGLPGAGAVAAWLRTVAGRVASGSARAGARRRAREEAASRPEAVPAPSTAEQRETTSRLVSAVNALPAAARDAV